MSSRAKSATDEAEGSNYLYASLDSSTPLRYGRNDIAKTAKFSPYKAKNPALARVFCFITIDFLNQKLII